MGKIYTPRPGTYDELGIGNFTDEEIAHALPCYVNHCGGFFIPRTNRKDGNKFFGCVRYPACTATRVWEDVEDELYWKLLGGGNYEPDYFGE